MDGLWHDESQGTAETPTCGYQASPFPSGTHAAYYGAYNEAELVCRYNNDDGGSSLTLASDLDLSGADAG